MNNKGEKIGFVLSGGGSRGAYEAGSWQALTELGIEIDIVTGASVGAINGAMVCQGDLENTIRLWKEIETHMIFDLPEDSTFADYAKEMLNGGAGTTGLRALLEKYIDEDRVRNSPIDYGLVVVERAGFKTHYLTKNEIPKGQLIDYILASSSVFPAIHPHEIDGIEYIDGGYADVLPVGLAIDLGAERVIAVKLNATGILRRAPLRRTRYLKMIESAWNLGSTLVFDTKNSKRIMRLGYLDTMKAFKVFDGSYFAFAKGTFSKSDTKMADACAHMFNMDPTLIYTKESFLDMVPAAVADAHDEIEKAWDSLKTPRKFQVRIGDYLRDLKSMTTPRALCYIIAQQIKENKKDSMFLGPTAAALIPEHVLAARFLANYNLV